MEINVGDIVRLPSWEEMVRLEHPTDGFQQFANGEYVVEDIRSGDGYADVRLEGVRDFSKSDKYQWWWQVTTVQLVSKGRGLVREIPKVVNLKGFMK